MKKKHLTLLVILLGVYTVFGSVPVFSIRFNYVTWYCVLFIIASYIRLYPKKLWNNTKLWGWLTLILILTAYASVLACTYLPPKLGIEPRGYFFLSDSNKILAVLLGISSFLFFKNVKIRQSAFINTVASTTFGVLLIHANSDTMRQWLWVDTLKNTQMFSSNLVIIHAIGAVAAVFIICSFIDFLRIKLIENPLFNWLKRHNTDSLFDSKINSILNKLCNKYNAR